MSEQTPPMGGLHQQPEKIERLLSMVREWIHFTCLARHGLLLCRKGRSRVVRHGVTSCWTPWRTRTCVWSSR